MTREITPKEIRAREKAATIVVFLEEGLPESHDLASEKDWSVIFEDVLEVKGQDATTYYPLDAVRKWTVHPRGRNLAPPARIGAVPKQDAKARV